MRTLVRHVEEGGRMDSHADVPESVRQQLYAEQQEHGQRQQKTAAANVNGFPPITINIIMPGTAAPSSDAALEDAANFSTSKSAWISLGLSGFRAAELREYSEWHQLRVYDVDLKADYTKARDVALADAVDLDVISHDNNPDYFV